MRLGDLVESFSKLFTALDRIPQGRATTFPDVDVNQMRRVIVSALTRCWFDVEHFVPVLLLVFFMASIVQAFLTICKPILHSCARYPDDLLPPDKMSYKKTAAISCDR